MHHTGIVMEHECHVKCSLASSSSSSSSSSSFPDASMQHKLKQLHQKIVVPQDTHTISHNIYAILSTVGLALQEAIKKEKERERERERERARAATFLGLSCDLALLALCLLAHLREVWRIRFKVSRLFGLGLFLSCFLSALKTTHSPDASSPLMPPS